MHTTECVTQVKPGYAGTWTLCHRFHLFTTKSAPTHFQYFSSRLREELTWRNTTFLLIGAEYSGSGQTKHHFLAFCLLLKHNTGIYCIQRGFQEPQRWCSNQLQLISTLIWHLYESPVCTSWKPAGSLTTVRMNRIKPHGCRRLYSIHSESHTHTHVPLPYMETKGAWIEFNC